MHEHARRANRLLQELSPYLLQHAYNPVDWYAWGEPALARARSEDKPIFLSIGYSTCHWCHVMERESFEDETIAALMNRHFVSIKVDREERPDLDDIYMNACQLLTGRGGWPLSVFLLPDRRPFLAGTYFPPEDRHGMRGFRSLLELVAEAWQERREEVVASADKLHGYLLQLESLASSSEVLDGQLLQRAFAELRSAYDPQYGGFGRAPKFPRPDYGSLCLRRYHRERDPQALQMALHTLDRMAAGGIYDHLGGGFHRYSTDAEWLAPHFEKMLYDNAQLAFHYTEAYQLTGSSSYAEVVHGTLEYLLRDLRDPQGGFYSAEDADSEGEEGTFYVWTLEQLASSLPPSERQLFADAYDLSARGNWEGRNILRRVRSAEELRAAHDGDAASIEARLAQARATLLQARAQRVRPSRDEKVLSAWNGLAIGAFARAGIVFERPNYVETAERAAEFLRRELYDGTTLLRRWRAGQAGIAAFAEDYSCLVWGLLELYQANLSTPTLEWAMQLQEEQLAHFLDPKDGALWQARPSADELIVRSKGSYDGATPSANSLAARNLHRLGELTGEQRWESAANRLFAAFASNLRERPLALCQLLLALDEQLGERLELVLSGPPESAALAPLLRLARSGYQPDLSIAYAPAERGGSALAQLPALAGKGGSESPTAYLCRRFSCQRPTGDAPALLAALAASRLD